MTDWADGRSTRLLPRVRRPTAAYAAPTRYSPITLVATWEGFAGQFGDIEWVFKMMATPADRAGTGYRIVGKSSDFAGHPDINVRKEVLELFFASGMAVAHADLTRQPKARPEDRSNNGHLLPDDRPQQQAMLVRRASLDMGDRDPNRNTPHPERLIIGEEALHQPDTASCRTLWTADNGTQGRDRS